jgi:predicted nucleic acid-binding protein
MSSTPHRAVFDCVVFAQFLISPRGPATHCFEQVRRGRVQLFANTYIIHEILALPLKIPRRYGITLEDAVELADEVREIATIVDDAPSVYVHPVDPSDSTYIDLALATASKLIISRDRHLLNLMDAKRPDGKHFRSIFPQLVIMPPHEFAKQLREEEAQGGQ